MRFDRAKDKAKEDVKYQPKDYLPVYLKNIKKESNKPENTIKELKEVIFYEAKP